MIRRFAFLLLLLCANSLFARHFEFTPPARKAYEKVLSLRFQEALALLAQQRLQDPDNLIVHHIENYIDFFSIYISEDPALYKRLKKNKSTRLEKIEAGDPDSPHYLFVQADIRLQWALIQLKFEDYLGAFSDVSKAYKLLQKNRARFPNFMPNLKDLGILHAMVGTIPDSYKWGVRLLGMDGTIAQGQKEIEQVLAYAKNHDFIFETETTVLYAFFLLHLKNAPEKAWSTISNGQLQPASNPLHCFIMANVGMRADQNDAAIRILQNRPQGPEFFDFPYLDFMLGMAKLRRLDADADIYFSQFLKNYRGQNFIKETYQKLAWHELIKGNTAGYNQYMKACIDHGIANAGEDKNALLEAQSGKVPLPTLIKARLLFDGGYFQRAHESLKGISPVGLSQHPNRLEYVYRMGRILHGLSRYDEAITYYKEAIRQGEDEPFFYACNAALQIALIYERQKNISLAKTYFEKCLDIYPDEYRTGLHQKAKSGLERIRG